MNVSPVSDLVDVCLLAIHHVGVTDRVHTASYVDVFMDSVVPAHEGLCTFCIQHHVQGVVGSRPRHGMAEVLSTKLPL